MKSITCHKFRETSKPIEIIVSESIDVFDTAHGENPYSSAVLCVINRILSCEQ